MRSPFRISLFTLIALSPATLNSAHAGNLTFTQVCSECHTGGFKGWVSGAPNIQNKTEWTKFIERDSADKMKKIVLNGSAEHKVKGGCKSCSSHDIENTIDYMLSLVK